VDELQPSDPKTLGQYELSKRIGSGGFGIVYLATARSGQQVAIKVLRSELADDQRLRARLAREARAIAAVQGTRTVKVFEVVTDGPFAYLVMEYVEGKPLDELVEEGAKPEGPLLWFLALGLVEALQEIHAAGITHRDLKPSNVIVGPEGVKVLDFGISAIKDEAGFTQTGALMGSAAWLSPEQVTGAATDQRTDIFNLGLILGYMASGVHPFGSGRPDAVMYRITSQDPNTSALPEPFEIVVNKCLQKSPADRPSLATLQEFFQSGGSESSVKAINSQASANQTFLVQPSAIEAAVAAGVSSSPLASGQSVSDKSTQHRPRRQLLGIAVGVAVVVAAVLGVFLYSTSGSDKAASSGGNDLPSSTTPITSSPVVKTTLVPPTTTTEPLPAGCYRARDMGGNRTICNVPRASRPKELNFLSATRVIIGVDTYNAFSPQYQSAEEAWLTLGYALCEGLSYSRSYEDVMASFDGIQGKFEYEMIFVAAIQTLCDQLSDLIP
jgi:serine/threonine protein kinase